MSDDAIRDSLYGTAGSTGLNGVGKIMSTCTSVGTTCFILG